MIPKKAGLFLPATLTGTGKVAAWKTDLQIAVNLKLCEERADLRPKLSRCSHSGVWTWLSPCSEPKLVSYLHCGLRTSWESRGPWAWITSKFRHEFCFYTKPILPESGSLAPAWETRWKLARTICMRPLFRLVNRLVINITWTSCNHCHFCYP